MKILLVNPDFHSAGPENVFGTLPPLGLLYVGGALIDGGYKDVELIDLCKKGEYLVTDSNIGEYLVSKQPDILFIGGVASTATLPKSLAIAKAVKELKPEIKTVLGGVHPTFMYKNIMKENPYIDFIIRREGEIPSLNLVKSIDNNTNLEEINNIVWRDNENNLKINKSSKELVDLNKYLPAWNLVKDWECYRAPIGNEIAAAIQFSRGCDHKCTFCCQWMFWKKWHCRNPDSFAEEIKHLYNEYGVSFFLWADENAATDQEKWIEVLNSMKKVNEEHDYKLHHFIQMRVDEIIRDKDYLHLYKKAGIVSIDLGMESVSQQGLDYFKKETTTETNKKALELLREHDILSAVQILIKPDETYETLQETENLLNEWNPDIMHFYFTVPYPWTSFGKIMKDQVIESDFSKWDQRNPILKQQNMSIEEVIKISKLLRVKFTFNHKRIISIIQIKDSYPRGFMIDTITEMLKYWTGRSAVLDYSSKQWKSIKIN